MATKIKPLEEWKAPWEIREDGSEIPEDEQVIDAGMLKKYLHGLLTDKEKAVEGRETAQSDLAAANAKLDEAARQGESDEQRRERERQTRDKELEDARREAADARKLRIALKQKGISAEDAVDLADILKGETDDELEAHAKRLVERFKLAKEPAEGDGEDDGEEPHVHVRPQQRLRSGGDPAPGTRVQRSLEDELDLIRRPGQF